MKNKAEHRIRYHVITSETVFSRNSAKNDYLCREVSRENRRSLKCRTVFGERKQGFTTSLLIRERQRISNESFAQPLEILLFSHSANSSRSTRYGSTLQSLTLLRPKCLFLRDFFVSLTPSKILRLGKKNRMNSFFCSRLIRIFNAVGNNCLTASDMRKSS